MLTYFAAAYLICVVVMSLVAFVAYGFDKFRASREGRRVSEKTLQLIALFGGWPGALLAQQTFRHKTQKTKFLVVFWLCATVNLLVFVGGLYLLWS